MLTRGSLLLIPPERIGQRDETMNGSQRAVKPDPTRRGTDRCPITESGSRPASGTLRAVHEQRGLRGPNMQIDPNDVVE
jgi:hypothetical protein